MDAVKRRKIDRKLKNDFYMLEKQKNGEKLDENRSHLKIAEISTLTDKYSTMLKVREEIHIKHLLKTAFLTTEVWKKKKKC